VVHADTAEDQRRLGIWALSQTLQMHGLIGETAESAPVLVVAGAAADGFRTVTVRCDHRPEDSNALWYFLEDGDVRTPIGSVGRPEDAMTAILGERVIRS
jgi:hypothetical protein